MRYHIPKKLPSTNYRRSVEELAKSIPDPVRKLKFLKHVLKDYSQTYSDQENNEFSENAIGENGSEYIHSSEESFRNKRSGTPYPSSPWIYRHRHAIASSLLIVTVWVVFILALSLIGMISNADIKNDVEIRKELKYYPVTPPEPESERYVNNKKKRKGHIQPYLDKLIWQVEKRPDLEIYNNRLQIITIHTIDNIQREYHTFPKNSSQLPDSNKTTDKIVGILYHATESDIFDYKPEMTDSIRKYSKALIKYICKKKSYNYFIDRFGQVYRIVREDHAAYHAGNSIWADDENSYLNLNHAFLGICFEGRDFEKRDNSTEKANKDKEIPNIAIMESFSINEAQLRSGKELTDYLRIKYRIHQHNCVPHGLVSVNPYKLLIGLHLDLSYGFPFDQYNLSNKYKEHLPSITDFGLTYDEYFVEIFQGDLWPGIRKSIKRLKKKAKRENLPLKEYRKVLNERYTKFFKWQKELQKLQEKKQLPSG